MLQNNKWNQLAVFLIILGINTIIFSQLVLVWHSASMDEKYVNALASVGILGLTSLIYAFALNRRRSFAYLKMNEGVKWDTALALVLVFCVSMPALGWIIKWNEGLHLPQVFSATEQWMREQEDMLADLTKQMLAGTSLTVLFTNLLVIAVVPAICEELLFRGVFLSWLKDGFRNKHLAVWLSAIIFSAFHVQFFGFFPRMLLGVYLGYLFVWTGSLWTPIIAHFLNNAVIVIASFLYNIGYIATDYEQIGNGGENAWIVALSLCFTTVLIVYLWKNKTTSASPA